MTCLICNQKECPKLPYYGKANGTICNRVKEHYGYWENGEIKITEKGIEYYKELLVNKK